MSTTPELAADLVRSRDGMTLHRAGCSRARTAEPWPWSDGRTLLEVAGMAARMGVRACTCDSYRLGP